MCRRTVITFVAITLPFFGDLLGFVGALATGPTTFWLPSLMWLILKRPTISNVSAVPARAAGQIAVFASSCTASPREMLP